MKKVVVESIFELREIEKLNEEELNEFNLADFTRGFIKGQAGKAALELFLKNIEGKTEIPDEDVNKAFYATFARTFGKHADYKAKTAKLPLNRKMELMKHSAAVMKKDPNKDTPILVWNTVKSIWVSGAISSGQASGTHGQATSTSTRAKPAKPVQ